MPQAQGIFLFRKYEIYRILESRHLARTISCRGIAIFNLTINLEVSPLLNHSKAIRRIGNRNANSFINET